MRNHFSNRNLLVLVLIIGICLGFDAVHCYDRPPARKTVFVPHDEDDSAPQQVLHCYFMFLLSILIQIIKCLSS